MKIEIGIFEPKGEQLKVYKEIKEAIEDGELHGIFNPLHKGIYYFVRPWNLIKWALLKGYIFPENLQEALMIRQVPNLSMTKPLDRKIRRKIVAQLICSEYPNLPVSKICSHDWMKCVGEDFHRSLGNKKDDSAVRKAVNELFSEKGQHGQKMNERRCTSLPIYEVAQINENGQRIYQMQGLRIAMKTIAMIILNRMTYQTFDKMTFCEFWEFFIRNGVVKIYLDEASELVQAFVQHHVYAYCGDLSHAISISELPWHFLNRKQSIGSTNERETSIKTL